MTCNCYSSNADIGEVREVTLDRPDFLPDGERVNGVPVDACIAATVEHLWANGVHTWSSCCGHNGHYGPNPDLVLSDDPLTPEQVARIHQLIAETDPRPFTLYQWQLTALPHPHQETDTP